jgi:hypothetical protein
VIAAKLQQPVGICTGRVPYLLKESHGESGGCAAQRHSSSADGCVCVVAQAVTLTWAGGAGGGGGVVGVDGTNVPIHLPDGSLCLVKVFPKTSASGVAAAIRTEARGDCGVAAMVVRLRRPLRAA